MGKILAYSGMIQNKEVSWMPSFGPEMRGGTANFTVSISEEKINSPILNSFDTAIILSQQSLDKFEKAVKPGGLMIYDRNSITQLLVRPEFIHKGLEKSLPARHHKLIPENEIAIEIGKSLIQGIQVLN